MLPVMRDGPWGCPVGRANSRPFEPRLSCGSSQARHYGAMPRKGDELPLSLWSSARVSACPRLKSDHDGNRVRVIARPYQLPCRHLRIDGIRIAANAGAKAGNERCSPAPVAPNGGMGGVGIKL